MRISDDVLKQVKELEEGIIKDEILPALNNDIAPRLAPIKRDLMLVVEYHPGEPLSVALSRKTKINTIVDAQPITSQISTPISSEEVFQVSEPHEPTKKVENKTKGLRVTFSDGTVVWHRKAIDTVVDTLRKIGFQRISELGLKHAGYNLVSREKRPVTAGHSWQHEVDGWYVYSNISNEQKIADLKNISERLRLGLIIEELKPDKPQSV